MASNKFIFEEEFKKDIFLPRNVLLKQKIRKNLPYKSLTDAKILTNQINNIELNYFYNNMLQNDKFIRKYLLTAKSNELIPDFLKFMSSYDTYVDGLNDAISREFDDRLVELLKLHNLEYHGDLLADDTKTLNYLYNKGVDLSCSNVDIENLKFTVNDNIKLNSQYSELTYNDIVHEFEFSEDTPDMTFVYAQVYNSNTAGKYVSTLPIEAGLIKNIPDIIKPTYILKKWMSGSRELYIYLPSTFTIYSKDEDSKTLIEIKLHKQHFDIHKFFDILINAESLPLNISVNDDFTKTIRLSKCKTPPFSVGEDNLIYQDNNFYYLYFICCNSDALSIRVMFE